MKIGRAAVQASPERPESTGEWYVRVSTSVVRNVPADILRYWIVLETFAREKPECWPGNRALAAEFGVKLRQAKYIVETLEDHAVIVRRMMPGNRRILQMVRRTSGTMSAVEWKAIAERAERLADGRAAVSKANGVEKKRYKPPVKIVG
jgi:hypothetical protein